MALVFSDLDGTLIKGLSSEKRFVVFSAARPHSAFAAAGCISDFYITLVYSLAQGRLEKE